MGNATQFTETIKASRLTPAELKERRQGARVREDVTTTVDGEIVEQPEPKAAPLTVYAPQPATWD
jgi:hypothetical protein